jgi:hypothetical protein
MRERAVQHAQKKHEHRAKGNNEEACATDAAGEGGAAFTKTAGVTSTDEDKSASLRGREEKSSSSAGSGTGTDTTRAEEKEPLQAVGARDSSTAESSGSSAGAKMAMSDKSTDSSSKGSSSPINAHSHRDGGSSKAVQRVGGTLNQPLESARRSSAEATMTMSDRGASSSSSLSSVARPHHLPTLDTPLSKRLDEIRRTMGNGVRSLQLLIS